MASASASDRAEIASGKASARDRAEAGVGKPIKRRKQVHHTKRRSVRRPK